MYHIKVTEQIIKKLNPEKYDSDKKLMPSYVKNYEKYFFHLVNDKIKLLELGVFKGGSLKMWRDYFEKGAIVGLDMNGIEQEDFNNIVFYQGLQDDKNLLDKIAKENAPNGFDVIIDDCSHIGKHTRTSFWYLFDNYLKPGGIYVIEDWGTGYWENWPDGTKYIGKLGQDSDTPTNHSSGMVGFVKELIDECGAEDITSNKSNEQIPRKSKFSNISISSGQVFIFKN